ncbi:hypothetical protein Nmel_002877 [Mimus melanotis]
MQVLSLVSTLLFCALTFACFFFSSQLSTPVQVLKWEELSTSSS